MARKRLTSLPEGLWLKLAELEAYVRQLDMVRGLGWTLAIAAISLGLGLLADIALELPLVVRVGILASAGLVTLVTAYGMIWRPWRRQRSVLDLAAVVERANPELNECLVSCIELYDTAIPESERGSALMRELAAKQALHNVSPLDFCAAVSPHPAHRMAIGGLLAWTLLLVPLLLPSNYRLLMTRFFTPWQNLDRVTTFWFEVERGDRVVVRGSDVILTAQPKGIITDLPATAELKWVNDEGESDSRRVDYDAVTGVYATTIPHVMHGFQYHLSGGGNRSRTYQIQVVEAPAITGLKVEIQPPAYTGQPAKLLDGAAGEITVLERSRINWQLTFNKPLQSAEWQWQPDPAVESKSGEPAAEPVDDAAKVPAELTGPPAIPFKLAADRLSATWESVPEDGGMFRLVVRDEHGLTNETDGARHLIVTPDVAPTLTVEGRHDAEVAQASDVVPIHVDATDDAGIGALELHYEIDATRKGILKCEQDQLGKPQVQHQFDLHLTDLQVRNGEVVSYRVRAADERPIPGPNETWSDQRMIKIDAKAKPPGSQQLALDQQQMQQFLKQLHGDVTAQEKQAQELQKQSTEVAKDDPADARELQRSIEKAADQQAKLQARLEQLAAAFENHPLFANLAQQAQQLAATEFAQAQADLMAAEQAEKTERTEKLQAAQEQLAKADQQLDALEQQFEKLAKLEQDLLELNRLAANADQLAQRLKALDQKQREPVPLQETEQQRENREQLQKAEENQLVAQQKELTNKAADLLQKQPELQQAARQNQLQQLAQLTERAEQLAQPQQELANELQAAAEQSARSTEDLAERQAELQNQIEKLNEQVAEKRPPGVQPIDPAELEKALEELLAGNLGAAEKEEERLAKQLEELEKKLQAANQSNAEQAQKLADQQAAAAKAAQDAAQEQTAPAKEQQDAAGEELAEATEELRKLQPEQAEKEKEAAEAAVAEAAKKQQELAEKSTRPDPESKATPEEKEEELQRLLKENAEAQQAAAESLQKLADQLQPPASEKAGTEQTAGTNEGDKAKLDSPAAPAKPAAETEKLDAPGKPDAKPGPADKPAGKSEDPSQAAGEKSSAQKSPAASKPESANSEGAEERPKSSAQQAAELAQAARALQQELAQAQQAQDLSQSAEKQKQLTETLRRLNEEIQKTAERMQQSPAANEPAPKGDQRPPPESSKSPSEPSSQAAQNKLAQAAMEAAQRELQQGNLEKSAAAGQQAAEALQQLAQAAKQSAEPNNEPSSKDASSGQRPMPSGSQKPATNGKNSAEGAVPPEAARQVAEAVQQLQEALSPPRAGQPAEPTDPQPGADSETGSKSPSSQNPQPASGGESKRSPMTASQPGAPQPGESKPGESKSGESKSGESKSGDSKGGESKSGASPSGESKSGGTPPGGSKPGSSSEAASPTSGGLPMPGASAPQSPQSSSSKAPGSQPSPSLLQSAAERLQSAAATLRQASSKCQGSKPGSGSGGSSGRGSPDGKSGTGVASNGPPQSGQPGPGDPNGNGQSVPGEAGPGNGKPGPGGNTDVDAGNLARLKKRLAGRKWGELPGTLQTEILQAAQKKPNSEYGELIRQYFKEIAKTQPATTAP